MGSVWNLFNIVVAVCPTTSALAVVRTEVTTKHARCDDGVVITLVVRASALPTICVALPQKLRCMKTIVASRCVLEPQVTEHAAEMFGVLSDPAIYEFENEPPPSQQSLRSRYERLEKRGPADASEQWLNWVIRLPSGVLAGYVQATVLQTGVAYVAYELNSQHWRQGFGSSAVGAMLEQLRIEYEVHTFVAVLKVKNFRSMALLQNLGFTEASAEQQTQYRDEEDELVMFRTSGQAQNAA